MPAITDPIIAARVKFPATQVPSSDVNTLDDYEEGTFTPTLSFGGGSTGLTYSTQTGSYIKIGQLVIVHVRIQLSAKGSSVGGAAIAGLPFAVHGTHFAVTAGYYTNMATMVDGLIMLANAGASTVSPFKGGATSIAGLDDTNFTNSSDLIFSLTYRTSA